MDYKNLRATDGNGPAALAHIESPRSIGGTVLDVDTLDNWPNEFICTTGTPLANGFLDPATLTEFKGHIETGDIVIDEILDGFTDLGNTTSQVAIIKPTGTFADEVVDLARVAHNDDGSLKNAIILYNNLSANLLQGWIDANETWAYVSGTGTITGVFKIVGIDLTAKYQAGDRVKLTQTQVKYGIITKVAMSGSDTQITVLMSVTAGAVDNSGLTNTTISANYYSRVKAPYGFPMDPSRWMITVTDTASRSGTTTGGVVINPSSLKITLPIGSWDLSFEAAIFQSNSSSGIYAPYGGLSTANNSFSDNELICDCLSRAAGTAASIWPVTRRKMVAVTSITDYFLVVTCQVGGGTLTVGWEGTRQTTKIRAICAYL